MASFDTYVRNKRRRGRSNDRSGLRPLRAFLLLVLCSVAACGGGAGGAGGSRAASGVGDLPPEPVRREPPASELVQQGEQRLADNDPAGARPLFERAVAENPQDARAHFDLALALESLGEIAGAEEHYRRAVALQGDFAEALNNLGLLLRGQGKSGEAIGFLRGAVAANPGSDEGHMNLALALEENGELPAAEAEYRESLRINPGQAMTRANLGLLLIRTGKVEEAAAELKRALPQARGNRAALLAIGNGLRRAGEFRTAVSAMKEAVKAGESGPTPALLSELALAQLAAGERPAAMETARKAIELDARYAVAHYLLANMLAADGKYAEAISHYQRYLKLEPQGEQAARARERMKRARQAKNARAKQR
jgi:Tfp pilus assembly protein PilF